MTNFFITYNEHISCGQRYDLESQHFHIRLMQTNTHLLLKSEIFFVEDDSHKDAMPRGIEFVSKIFETTQESKFQLLSFVNIMSTS